MTETTTEALPVPASSRTALSLNSSAVLDLQAISRLPARLDDGMMASLQQVLDCPIPEQVPVSSDYLSKALMAMIAVLPRQGKDAATGALMVDQYCRKLGKHPKGAIDHLWSASIDRLKWFPTIAECNEIAGEWIARSQNLRHAKSIAGSRIRRENQDRFDDAMRNLRMGKLSQVEIDALPDAWKRYAENQGHLHLLRDGSYIARPSSIWATDEVLAEAREQLAKAREDGLL